MRRFLVSCALVCAASAASSQTPRLGTIDFPTSGAPAARPHFIRGVLYLHSFEYDSAAKSFREAQRIDPGFAMAYWGEAMTYTHPVWNQQDVPAARAVLQRLGRTPNERLAKAPTPRERAYVAAVEALYGDGGKERRDTLFADAVQRITEKFPDDVEARAFHALALLGLNQGVRDVATYMRAAAIADDILRAHPDHPGAAHYVIHSFDDPTHAPLGLRAARMYSKIAPSAGHAQHMTSHIFIAMGMWPDVVKANETAFAQSHESSGHYAEWLHYGYLQQGRYKDAARLLARYTDTANARGGGAIGAAAAMRAAYLIETERWADSGRGVRAADAVKNPAAAATAAYVNAYAAMTRGDTSSVNAALATIDAVLNGKSRFAGDARIQVARRELVALRLRRRGQTDSAVATLRATAEFDESQPYEFGPPLPAKPPRELLGEVLFAAGRHAEAKGEFARALERAPERTRSLLGIARAATQLGQRDEAARVYRTLQAALVGADADLLELADIRRPH